MSTILGPLPCRDCREPVSIVRRTVEVCCGACERTDCLTNHRARHTHAIPDVAWTVVDAEGERHLCRVTPL